VATKDSKGTIFSTGTFYSKKRNGKNQLYKFRYCVAINFAQLSKLIAPQNGLQMAQILERQLATACSM